MIESFTRLCSISNSQSALISPSAYPKSLEEYFPKALFDEAYDEISTWPNYQPTPVCDLAPLADALNIEAIHYKDESSRFGLGSFKALGGAYAVMQVVADLLSTVEHGATPASVRKGEHKQAAGEITVTTATDGNHGRSVAWGAQMAGCACKIFIHRDVSSARAEAMAQFDAEIIRIEGDYDESVRACAKAAKDNEWQVISDTSWEGYSKPPTWVMAGYTVMITELLQQLSVPPTHLFLPAGVGGLAAAVIAAYWQALDERLPRIAIVESELAACLFQSARVGEASDVILESETLMAGLSCGETSPLAWEVISRSASDFITISDKAVPAGMRLLASGHASDAPIEAGECSLAGLVGLAGVSRDSKLRNQLGLNQNSRVLVLGTEGATDAEIYRQILQGSIA